MTKARGSRRSALGLVFLTVFIDLIGFGIVLPLIPYYAETLGANAFDVGAIIAAYSAMQFLFAPVWGRLSDRYGRRPILLVGLAGSAASYVLFALAGSVSVLLASRVVAGIMGANVPVAQAYIADSTADEERAKGMGLIGVAFGLGFILGPAIGGVLSRWGYATPGYFAAALSLSAALVALRLLPESLPPERRSLSAPGGLEGLRDRIGRLRETLAMASLRNIMAALFLGTIGFAAFTTTFPLLLQQPLGLSAMKAGLYLALVGVASAVVQGRLIGPVVARHGEPAVAAAGAVTVAVGLALLPWLHELLLLGVPLVLIGAGWGFVSPALQGLLSREAGLDRQGGVLGVNQSLSSLARVVGPLAGGWAFGALGFRVEFLLLGALLFAAAAWIRVIQPAPASSRERLAT